MAEDPMVESLSEILGGCITTYPEGDDNNRKIHNGCLELEKRGLIRRRINEPKQVLWMPVMDEDRISGARLILSDVPTGGGNRRVFPRPTTFAQASFISSLRLLADALEAFPDVKAVAVDINEECEIASQDP